MRRSIGRGLAVRRASLLATSLCAGVAGGAFAQSGGPGLDRLLRLPDTIEYSAEEKGGASRSEWRQRFGEAHASIAEAERALAATQSKLAAVAGSKSEWQLAPPGVPAEVSEDSSSNYQLRDQVRRERAEVERARARLRELDVRADLAGVPEEWRSASTDARSNDTAGDGSGTPTDRVR